MQFDNVELFKSIGKQVLQYRRSLAVILEDTVKHEKIDPNMSLTEFLKWLRG